MLRDILEDENLVTDDHIRLREHGTLLRQGEHDPNIAANFDQWTGC